LVANNSLVRTGAAGLGGSGSVHVCGVEHRSPNGDVPIKNIPQFSNGKWGLVDDEHPGANPSMYGTLCAAQGTYPAIQDPGNGLLTNLAIGQCNEPAGCQLYRVFDEKPITPVGWSRRLSSISTDRAHVQVRIAKLEGRSWAPRVSLLDNTREQGKSYIEYARDMGICRWRYKDTTEEGSLGGYLVKCNVPAGDDFIFGQGQSIDCQDEDHNEFRIPPSSSIQIRKDSCDLVGCEWCATKDYNKSTRDAPDVTACDDKGWISLASPDNPEGKVLDRLWC